MSYSTAFVSLFKIPGCLVRDVQVSDAQILVEVHRRRKTGTCPRCSKRSKHVHDRRVRKVLHTIIGTQQLYLLITRRRFFCVLCSCRFAEEIPFLLGKKRRTTQLTQSILSRLKKESFRSTTESIGISYAGLRDCLMTVVNPFLPNWSDDECKPFALGIDEHYAKRNRYVLSVTNLTRRKPITFLPSDKVSLLKRFISQMPTNIKGNITEVCCDMHEGFIGTVTHQLPEVPIVIDHFHLIQDANRRVNEARLIEQDRVKTRLHWKLFVKNSEDLGNDEQKKLTAYCVQFPLLHCFYRVKEDLRAMYRCSSREQAAEKLKELRLRMEALDIIELKLWARSLRRHEQYILNFFNNCTTNAYTEGIHVKCKLTQRISFGFRNLEVYIRKAMLAFLPLSLLVNHPRF